MKFLPSTDELLNARLEMVVRSAKVRRYHTEHTQYVQSVGEHTYGVMWLVMILTGGDCSKNLLAAALMHDAPEYYTGDVPSPSKRRGGVKEVFDALEDEFMNRLGLPNSATHGCTEEELRILKLADCLEGALFCLSEFQRGNAWITQCLDNYIAYTRSMAPQGVAMDILNIIERAYDEHGKQ